MTVIISAGAEAADISEADVLEDEAASADYLIRMIRCAHMGDSQQRNRWTLALARTGGTRSSKGQKGTSNDTRALYLVQSERDPGRDACQQTIRGQRI